MLIFMSKIAQTMLENMIKILKVSIVLLTVLDIGGIALFISTGREILIYVMRVLSLIVLISMLVTRIFIKRKLE